MELYIKICVDPCCEAIYHNTPKKQTRCLDCGGNMIIINQLTYANKFINNWFQYDFLTQKYYRPIILNPQLKLEI